MQLSIIYSWECTNIDTISAFLHQSRPPTAIKIYTRIEQKICNLCDLDPKQFYIIDKYLYGLPDSGKAYYEAITTLLTTNNFIQSIVDNCLYYLLNTKYNIYIITYVDDTYIFSTNISGLSFAKSIFKSKFPIQDGDPTNYLGLNIQHTILNNQPAFHITQPKLLQEIINDFIPKIPSLSTKIPTLITKEEKLVPIKKLFNYEKDIQNIHNEP